MGGFALGDSNYPINPELRVVNRSGRTIPAGLRGDFHRVRLNIPAPINSGAFAEVTLNYVLPISGPANFTLTFGGQTYALSVDQARGSVTPPTNPPSTPPGSTPPGGCTAAPWSASTVYTGGNLVSHAAHHWRAKWWTQGENPSNSGQWGVWADLGAC